jgi:hypothetical protein
MNEGTVNVSDNETFNQLPKWIQLLKKLENKEDTS